MNANERITRQFTQTINELSRENESNTHDFVLAEFLTTCLVGFENAVNLRQQLKDAKGPDECREETREELEKSRDEWKRLALENRREAEKWRHAQAEYKKALGKCSDGLLKCIEAKESQTRKLKKTLDELTALKTEILDRDFPEQKVSKKSHNLFNAIADGFGQIVEIMEKQKRREAEAFKAMAEGGVVPKNEINEAALLKWRIEWVTERIQGTRKKLFDGDGAGMANVYSVTFPDGHVYSFRIFDNAEQRAKLFDDGVRYIASHLTLLPDQVLESPSPEWKNGHVGFYWEPKREEPRPAFPESKKPRK